MSTLAPEAINPETLDLSFLRGTVQPQHLTPEAIRATREAFETHPAHVARLQNFLEPHIAERLSRALVDDIAYFRIRHLYSAENRNVTESEFLAADKDDQLLQFSQMEGVRQGVGLSPNLMQFMSFRKLWHDPEICGLPARIDGLESGRAQQLCGEFSGRGRLHQPAQ
jgi:hypothetical protein